MSTALTVYMQEVNASSTLSTANALIENGTTGASNTNKNSTIASGTTGWGEIFAQGTSNAWGAGGSAPSPSGNGWLDDGTTLVGNHFDTGTWTATVKMNMGSGSVTADIHVRAYQRSSGGVYTLIADMLASAQSITTSSSVFTCTASSVAASNAFVTGDKLYVDVLLNITASSSGTTIKIQESSSGTQGYTNAQVVSPGYLASTQIDKDVVLRARIQALVNKDVRLRGRLQQLVTKDIQLRGNVGFAAKKDVTLRGRIQQLTTKDIQLRGRLQQLTTKDIQLRGRIDILSTRDIRTRGIVAASSVRDVQMRGRIRVLVNKDLGLRGRPVTTVPKDIALRANVTSQPLASGGFTIFANGTGTALYDSVRITQYPDPSLSLSPIVPRLGTTNVTWNETISLNTTFGIDVSLDGVNWTDVTATNGASIPGLYSQTDPVIDGFDIDSSANYLATSGFIGQDSFVGRTVSNGFGTSIDGNTWTILGGTASGLSVSGGNAIVAQGAGNSTLKFGTLTASDTQTTLFCTFGSSTDIVGLDIRATNYGANTLYRLKVTPTTFTIERHNAGVVTTLTTISVSLSTSVEYGLRFQVLGSLLSARYWLENTPEPTTWQINVTDPSPLVGAGNVGVFALANSATSILLDTYGVIDLSRNATWTYDTANSRLIATGGTEGLYIYTLISRPDVDFFIDLDRADAGGAVWRYADQGNYYYLLITDSLSSTGFRNTVTIYRVANNVQTQLATAAITYTVGSASSSYTATFTRGTFHRFRVTMLLNVITVYIDGNILITYTDTTPLSTGMMGLYTNGGLIGSRFYMLWMQPDGDLVTGTPNYDIVTGKFVYTRVRLTTTDPGQTPQTQDLTVLATTASIQAGALIPSVTYTATSVAKNFDDLAKQSNYSWFIDQNKVFNFRSRAAFASPWILQSSPYGLVPVNDIEVTSNFELDVGNDLYRNRQTILGALDTQLFTETNVGDGSTRTFPLGYEVGAQPTVFVNGVPQTVGVKGSAGFNFYYAIGDPHLVQDVSGQLLQSSDQIQVTYLGLFPVTVVVDDLTQQALQQAIEGGSGIVESVQDVTGQGINKASAIALANQLLSRYGIAGRTLIFDTTRNGLQIGQMLTIFLPEHGILEGQFFITQAEISLMKGNADTQVWWYKVTASELPKKASWAKLLASGLGLQ